MVIHFTKEEWKRLNRLLSQEINETIDEMKSNHSMEIEKYFKSLLRHKNKVKLILKGKEEIQ